MAAATTLLSAEQAESICPACLGTGSHADELKVPAHAVEHALLAGEPCATCGGGGSLWPRRRLRRFQRIDVV